MFRNVIAVLVILLAGTMPALAKRVALVIGNSAYENAVILPNPVNDAKAITTKLRDLGFEVVAGLDQDYNGMRRTVADFAKSARGADIALMFYAGHGMQVRGQNYLIPVDARFADETALDFETMSVDFILRQMSNDVKVQMVFLDACRDNPLARSLARRMSPSRSANVGVGLAEIKLQETGGEGSVIAFATSPGDVALDGEGQNSPFTSALIRHIDAPNTSIQTVMTRVTGDVYRETDQRQRPWVNASLIGEVFLNKAAQVGAETEVASLGSTPVATTDAAAPAPSGVTSSAIAWEREKLIWDTVQSSNNAADYKAYLQAYPNGTFADFARNAIKRLEVDHQTAAINNPVNQTAETEGANFQNPQQTVAGTEQTEASLGWNRNARREVQTRLNLAGHNVGRADGAFGSNTRKGISSWQTANGLTPTGYFTAAQYGMLTTQTSAQYASYLAEVSRKQATVTRSTTRNQPQRTTNNTNQPSRTNNGGGMNPAGAAFLGGVVGGVIGAAIGR